MLEKLSVLAGAVLAGCSIDPAVAREAISGGVSDPTSSAVVGIFDDSTSGSCTGSLIAPNLVLTAQHCVAAVVGIPTCADGGRFGPPGDPGAFHVTTHPMITATPSDYRMVAEIVIPPGGDLFCGRDVALLVIAGNVPGSEASPIAPRFTAPMVGELYSAVGYGGIDDSATGAGERRRRDGLGVSCVGAACGVPDTEWVGEAGVCPGDSGGPALDASGRVIGVASSGSAGCVSPVYVGLGSYAAWLRAEGARAATRGGYAPPAWVGPALDAGAPDAGTPLDAGADAGSAPVATGDCSVASGEPRSALALALVLAVVTLLRSRRMR